ncbi:zona pellucida sperm-binding protein 3 isoform 2-T2 [Menidia menidia]
MVPMNTGQIIILFCSACCGVLVKEPAPEWERVKTVPKAESLSGSSNGSSVAGAKKFPSYLVVSSTNDHKEDLRPEKSSRDMPQWLQKVLMGSPSTFPRAGFVTHKPGSVGLQCHFDKIIVKIEKDVFKSEDAFKYLKLGTCPVTHGNKDYYFLMHSLKSNCGFKVKSLPDYLSIGTTLHYKPTSPVVRDMPFDILLQCRYPRWFYSYKVGYRPQLQGGTIYKALQPKSRLSISPQVGSGKAIPRSKTYNLGQPICFEASVPEQTVDADDRRIYIKKCFVTSSQDPNSHPKYSVIDNQGCMIDGKKTLQSKFLAGGSKMVQKFCLGTFLFNDSVSAISSQQLHIHCEMSVGPLSPSSHLKACNYDHVTKKWKELYGTDHVCACCESTCSSAKESQKLVSGRTWRVDSSCEEVKEDGPQMKSSHTGK